MGSVQRQDDNVAFLFVAELIRKRFDDGRGVCEGDGFHELAGNGGDLVFSNGPDDSDAEAVSGFFDDVFLSQVVLMDFLIVIVEVRA